MRTTGKSLVRECSTGRRNGCGSHACEPPVIVIGPGAAVAGTLRFERELKLYVSDRATVEAVEGAQAIVYSGEHPPISGHD